MTIKPFAIQGADLTLGGVNLQAGTTGVVIPGVTQAASFKVEEVKETDVEQTHVFALDSEVVVIDYVLYNAIVNQTTENIYADYTATTDDDGYIDDIEVNGQGTYDPGEAMSNDSNDMYAYIGSGSASDRPLVPEDWIQIPFRPKMRAGEVENIGGGADLGNFSISGNELTAGEIYIHADDGDLDIEADSDVNIVANDDVRITGDDTFELRNRSTTDPIRIITNYDQETSEHAWSFDSNGNLTLPQGGDILDSTGSSVLGGAATIGPLYIMANVDGNISTSEDGDTWSTAIDTGISIGTVAIGPGKIVYTRADHNGDAGGEGGPGTSLGLYSTVNPAVPPTLISGTDGNPGGELTWLQVQYFAGTTYPWVAVGFQLAAFKQPVLAYSADAIDWQTTTVDFGGDLTEDVVFTDIALGDGMYLISSRASVTTTGLWWTTDLTTTLTLASNNIALAANFETVEYWDMGGESQFYGRWHALTSSEGFWNGFADVTQVSNWTEQSSTAISDAIFNATGLTGQTMEESASGEVTGGVWMWLTSSSNGHIVHQANGPVGPVVSIPSPYTNAITDISRNVVPGSITEFTVSPTVGSQNTNWTSVPYNSSVSSGIDRFHIVIDGDGILTTCELTASDVHEVNDTITLYGAAFGGTSGIDDIVITVTAVATATPTTISYLEGGESGYDIDGEKITISGVTNQDASEPGTSDQSYNGTYYIKRVGSDPSYTYELYTDQALTTPWLTHTYWPVNTSTGTITWSHGTYLDSLGFANGHFYAGNDDDEIFKSEWNNDNTLSWTKVDDKNNSLNYWNDFAYINSFNAGGDTGLITFSGADIRGAGNINTAGVINLVPNSTLKSGGQYVTIYPTNQFDYPHVHIAAGASGELYIGSDLQYVKTGIEGNIEISSYNTGTDTRYAWNFIPDGSVSFPTLTVPISDNATPNGTGQTLKFSDSTQQAIIYGPQSTDVYNNAERVIIQGAPGYTGTTGEGGDVYVWAGPGGSGGGDGGDIKVRAGQGNGTGSGGYLNFQAGDSGSGYGGHINIESGETSTHGQGGTITLDARSGGEILLRVRNSEGNTRDLRLNNAGTLTLPGAVVKSTVAKTGADPVYVGSGEAATVIVSPNNNTNLTPGSYNGIYLGIDGGFNINVTVESNGDISAVVTSSNAGISLNSFGTLLGNYIGGATPADDVTITVASLTNIVVPTAIDLTKTINKLTDGVYTLADGTEGQIMYLVRSPETISENVLVDVLNGDGANPLYPFRTNLGFANVDNTGICTLIFTDGNWKQTGGNWD